MIAVTGAAGFIGANVVAALNRAGASDIVAVDPAPAEEAPNLKCLEFQEYMSADEFLRRFCETGMADDIDAVFHEGACSSTVERDEAFLIRNNHEYSRRVLQRCAERDIVCQYASSAGVYGHNHDSGVGEANEAPLTAYAKSKWMTDRFLRTLGDGHRLAGLRYFNVYGPGEGHKGFMRSTPLVFDEQLRRDGQVRVFGANEVCAAGEHRRDFVHIDDVVALKLWLWEHPHGGIYNVGTGRSRTFMEVAERVVECRGKGEVVFVPFPDELKSNYQNFTEADLSGLRDIGYTGEWTPMEEGVARYLAWLDDARRRENA